ncbi:MAG TPA: isochorismatase family protein [Patescibacteria group bacterium]|nr:isochorismatase family protein [Patescibacteria group bacterium]
MAEGYFTAGNIAGKSRNILEEVWAPGDRRDIEFAPDRAALLVIDMQRYFLDGSSHAFVPSAVPVIQRIKRLAGGFLDRGLPVILTRHLNTEDDAGMLARWWQDTIREDDPLSVITDELMLPGVMTVQKTQYDAFYRTELERALRERGVGQIVVTGVITHLCCETTARSAFVRGFAVFFAVDGTATYTEEFHRATVLNLSHGFAVPVLTDDLAARLAE